jgi:hypothetical protein
MIIKEHKLQVDEFPVGEERFAYSISEPVAAQLEGIVT